MKLNGVEVKCPTRYSELKTRHYQRIVKEWDQDKPLEERDYFKLFKILTDSDFDLFENTLLNQVKIETEVAWIVFEDFKFKTEFPKTFEYKGQTYNLPTKLKQLSIGANIVSRQTLDKAVVLIDHDGNLVNCDCYSMLTAIYLQPLLKPHETKGFNKELAFELEKEIAEMPIEIIRPIGFFLLQSASKYGKKQGKTFQQIPINLKERLKKMLPTWLKFKGYSHIVTLR